MPLAPSSSASVFPLPRVVIWLLCVAFPILGGGILYYSWRARYPAAARYANRASWVVFSVYLVLGVVRLIVQGPPHH